MTTSTPAPRIDPALCAHVPEIASSGIPPFGYDEQHKARGWSYRAEGIDKARALNAKESVLHLPDGCRIGRDPFEFDARLYWGDTERRIGATMEAALKPIIRAGHKITPYLGCLDCEGMRRLDWNDWMRRFLQVLKPWMDLGCKTIAFDASREHLADSREWAGIKYLQSCGIEVMTETRSKHAHHKGTAAFVVNGEWLATEKPEYGYLRGSDYRRVVRSVNQTLHAVNRGEVGVEVLRTIIRAILADGHTPGVDFVNCPGEVWANGESVRGFAPGAVSPSN